MPHPIERFKKLLKKAEKKGFPLPEAVALATVGPKGRPSVRMMLLKGADPRGFVFFTNAQSRKGDELHRNANAALCFWWPKLQEQVRVEGKVKLVSKIEADAYFATRPRGSQLGAWASRQSTRLPSRPKLLAAVAAYAKKFAGKPVPRPPYWLGYLLVPQRIEFWRGLENRLHHRELFTRRGKGWKKELLYP